jgi:hypothetical protein
MEFIKYISGYVFKFIRETLQFIAAILTIIQFFAITPFVFNIQPLIPVSKLMGYSKVTQVAIVFIFELALAILCGWGILKCATQKIILKLFIYFTIGLFSSWLSIFTLKYIILSDVGIMEGHIPFLLALSIIPLVILLITIYLTFTEIEPSDLIKKREKWMALSIQFFSFILIILAAILTSG